MSRRRTQRDARAYQLSLTVAGAAELSATLNAARETDDTLLSALSDQDREAFLAILTKIAEAGAPEAAQVREAH
ncbi:MAG: hypothetical protein R3D67_03510 [Hyphomicrobiaceae bacterium]